ncbi:endonuclease/exonuclease/phosphatase family protein [Chitinophaga sp. GCM10012297]|uniref:Endonuclease/exonuclease/phosphatase family protein n=1 Tax=Chitinophaga chungangae TaxID=2821488 RepID=A0ABS3YGM8_9BACT|nr:endonuclease/exonuclease/phosphatase family protein [Chitinophaga chungangae]MBO9153610.1 endonuclease/exonuclease/phosphatase family protein [Chitinophaga chungangae]
MKHTVHRSFILLVFLCGASLLFSCHKVKEITEKPAKAGLESNMQLSSLADFRVMQYNIHGGINTAGFYNLDSIAEVIRQADPDVVSLNEVQKNYEAATNYDDQVALLADALDMHAVFLKTTWKSPVPENGNKPREFGHAILSKYPIELLNARLYDDHDSHYFGLLETRIVINGHPVLFYGTHLAADTAVLRKQRQQLRAWMDQTYGTKILMGDLNEIPNNFNIEAIKETMVDAFEGQDTAYTFKSTNPTKRIDYILGTSNITFSNTDVKRNRHSDHHAIVADASVGTSKLKLMQYNIRHGEGTDGVVDLQRIAGVIRASKAQVVVLNEVDRNYDARSNYVDQLQWLADELGMYWEFQKTTWKSAIPESGNKPREFGHAILSKYPITKSSTESWLYASYTTHYMGLLKARISVNANPLYVYVTNFGPTAAERLSQAQEADSLAGLGNHTWKVFAGTLADIPGSAPVNTMLTSFTDVFSGQTAYTVPANAPTSREDYILVKSPVAAGNTAVISSTASTHRPIVCDIDMQ